MINNNVKVYKWNKDIHVKPLCEICHVREDTCSEHLLISCVNTNTLQGTRSKFLKFHISWKCIILTSTEVSEKTCIWKKKLFYVLVLQYINIKWNADSWMKKRQRENWNLLWKLFYKILLWNKVCLWNIMLSVATEKTKKGLVKRKWKPQLNSSGNIA